VSALLDARLEGSQKEKGGLNGRETLRRMRRAYFAGFPLPLLLRLRSGRPSGRGLKLSLEGRLAELEERLRGIRTEQAALESEALRLLALKAALDILRENPAEVRLMQVYLRESKGKPVEAVKT
jgi:hypothetical protein